MFLQNLNEKRGPFFCHISHARPGETLGLEYSWQKRRGPAIFSSWSFFSSFRLWVHPSCMGLLSRTRKHGSGAITPGCQRHFQIGSSEWVIYLLYASMISCFLNQFACTAIPNQKNPWHFFIAEGSNKMANDPIQHYFVAFLKLTGQITHFSSYDTRSLQHLWASYGHEIIHIFLLVWTRLWIICRFQNFSF